MVPNKRYYFSRSVLKRTANDTVRTLVVGVPRQGEEDMRRMQFEYYRRTRNEHTVYCTDQNIQDLQQHLQDYRPIDNLFILCHGDLTGRMKIGNQRLTLVQLCEMCLPQLRRQPSGFFVLPLVHCHAHEGNLDENTLLLLRQLEFYVAAATNDARSVTWNIPWYSSHEISNVSE